MSTSTWAELRKHADESTRPVPDGWYDVVCEKAEATVASTGSEMIKTTLAVVGGPHANRRLWTNFVLTPDNGFALQIFFRNLSAFGVHPEQVSPDGRLEPVAEALVGRRARAQVGHRTWQGQERNEIGNMVPADGPQVAAPGGGGGGQVPGGPPVPGGPGGPPAPSASAPTPTTPTPSAPTQAPTQVPASGSGDGPEEPPLPF